MASYGLFISWNHKDQKLKDKLLDCVTNTNGIFKKSFEKNNKEIAYNSDYDTHNNINRQCIESVKKSRMLLVLLTENSISSDWVEDEIKAFKESKNKVESDNIIYVVNIDFDELKKRNEELKNLEDYKIVKRLIEKYEKAKRIDYSYKSYLLDNNSMVYLSKYDEINVEEEKQINEKLKSMYDESLLCDSFKSKIKQIYKFDLDKEIFIERKAINDIYFDVTSTDDNSFIYINGNGGVGKTTAINNLVYRFADADNIYLQIKLTVNELIEKFKVHKNDLNEKSKIFVEIIKKILEGIFETSTDLKNTYDKILSNSLVSKNILLLDSLDEVSIDNQEYLNDLYTGLRELNENHNWTIILAGRNEFDIEYISPNGKKYLLDNFNEDEIRIYINGIKDLDFKNKEVIKEILGHGINPYELKLKIELFLQDKNVDIDIILKRSIYEIYDNLYSIDKLDSDRKNAVELYKDLTEKAYKIVFENEKTIYINTPINKSKIDILINKKIAIKDGNNLVFSNKKLESYFAYCYLKDNQIISNKELVSNQYYYDILLFKLFNSDKKSIENEIIFNNSGYLDSDWLRFILLSHERSLVEDTIKKLMGKCYLEGERNYFEQLRFLVDKYGLEEFYLNTISTDKYDFFSSKNSGKNDSGKNDSGIYALLDSCFILYNVLLKAKYENVNANFTFLYDKYQKLRDDFEIDYGKSLFEDINNLLEKGKDTEDRLKKVSELKNSNNYPSSLNELLDSLLRKECSFNSIKKYLKENSKDLSGSIYKELNELIEESINLYNKGFNIVDKISILKDMRIGFLRSDIICQNVNIHKYFEALINNNYGIKYVEDINLLNDCDLSNITEIIINQKDNEGNYNPTLFWHSSNLKIAYLIGIDEIKDRFFYNSCLTNCYIYNKNEKLVLGSKVFNNCSNLIEVVTNCKVDELKEGCFSDCINLKKLYIKNVKKVGDNAFNNCKNYSITNDDYNFKLDNVQEIGECSFINCENIASKSENVLKFSNKLEIIPRSAFEGCYSIEKICDDIKDDINITTIGKNAFGRTGLKNVSNIIEKVNRIESYSFTRCKVNELRLEYKDIAEGAFYNSCIEKIELIKCKNIASNAFSRVNNLKKVTIRNDNCNLLIGDFAFECSTNLDTLSITANKVIISKYAFYGCISLRKIYITAKEIEIGDYAFSYCYSLEKDNINIYINDKQINIDLLNNKCNLGKLVFGKTKYIDSSENIDKDEYNDFEKEFDSDLLSFRKGKPLYLCSSYDYMYEDKNYGFKSHFYYLEELIVDENINLVNNLFSNSHSLKKLELKNCNFYNKRANEITKAIPNNCFSFCENLEELLINDNSVDKIYDNAFNGCYALKKVSIPKSVKEIGKYAFGYCANLGNIELFSSTTLHTNCFYLPHNGFETTITVNVNDSKDDNEIKKSIEKALGYNIHNVLLIIKRNDSETKVECKIEKLEILDKNILIYSGDEINEENYKSIFIDDLVRCSFKNVENIKIDDSVNKLNKFEFNRETLRKVYLSKSIKEIPNYYFDDCINLSFIDLKDVEEIGDYAFHNTSLNSINLKKITKINGNVFSNCNKLETVMFSSFINKIRGAAFKDCINLKSIEFRRENKFDTLQFNNNCFEGCTKLSDITVSQYNPEGNTILLIKTAAFKGVGDIRIVLDNISKLSIESKSFDSNSKVEMEIKNKDKLKCYFSFDSLPLKRFKLRNLNELIKEKILNVSSIWINNKKDFKSLEQFKKISCINQITISENVEEIPDYAFENIQFRNITIPNSIKKIGDYAFKNNKFIEEITLPSNCIIGNGIFSNCTNLKNVTLPLIKKIPNETFENTYSLLNVLIPSDLELIGEKAFFGSGIEEFSFTNLLTSIGKNAFSNSNIINVDLSNTKINEITEDCFSMCYKINEVKLPNLCKFNIGNNAFRLSSIKKLMLPDFDVEIGAKAFYRSEIENICSYSNKPVITKIGEMAFSGCENLGQLDISSLEKIGERAFLGSGLEKVKLPEKTNIIPKEAFESCQKLEEISFKSKDTIIGEMAFNCCRSLIKINNSSYVKKIGEKAFCSCTSIETIRFENAIEVKTSAISFNEKLKTVSFDSLETIEDEILYGCKNLETISIPKLKVLNVNIIKRMPSLKKLSLDKLLELDNKVFDYVGHKLVVETNNPKKFINYSSFVEFVKSDFDL